MEGERRGGGGDEENTLLELNCELGMVVEALGFLHDFVESAFSAKFQSFCEDHLKGQQQQEDGKRSRGDPREALRELRSRHYNKGRKEGQSVFSKRASMNEEGEQRHQEERNRFGMVGQSEVVNVKYEVNCDEEEVLPDFLEDVDPFYGEGDAGEDHFGDFEGESSEINISSSSEPPKAHHHHPHSHLSTPDAEEGSKGNNNSQGSQGSRYIPGLIPIQSNDPLKQEKIDDGSESVSSDSSDLEWHPSSSTSSVSQGKKRTKGPSNSKAHSKKKSSTVSSVEKRHPPSGPTISSLLMGKTTTIQPVAATIPPPRYHHHQTPPQPSHNTPTEIGPFKCNQCPASYKQEESLKSHQKYKHNPSRVQCQCPLCGKSMVDKYRLQRHLRLHTGEKPFECQYCGQSFYRKDYHTKHMQRKHGLNFPQGYTTTNTTTSSSTSSSNSSLSGRKGSSSSTGVDKKVLSSPRQPPPSSSGMYGRSASSSSGGGGGSGFRGRLETTTSSSSQFLPAATSTSTSSSALPSTTSATTGFIDYLLSHTGTGSDGQERAGGGEGKGGTTTNSNCENSLGLTGSGLITMASLTFDDLISADM